MTNGALKIIPPSVLRTLREAKRQVVDPIRIQRLERRLAETPPAPALSGKPILFLTPEAGVTPHIAVLAMLARSLVERGHSVLFVRCYRLFSRCPVMDTTRLPYSISDAERKQVCLGCARVSYETLDSYNLPVLDLRTFVDEEIQATVQAAMKGASQDLREFVFDGIAFGTLAMMDLALVTKVSNYNEVNDDVRQGWLQYIESAILSYLLVGKLCDQIPLSGLAHYNDYSFLLGGHLAATKRGIPCFSITHATHKNVDRRFPLLRKDVGGSTFIALGRAWESWRDLRLTEDRVREGVDDLLARFGGVGSHMFSPAKTLTSTLRADLGVKPGQKLLAAFTSSLDEMISSRMNMKAMGVEIVDAPQPFENQIVWLQSLVNFVEHRDDLFLVVRIHPREGVKKRVGKSQHLERLKEALGRPLTNCRIIWPDEPVSSYDVAEHADVATVSWSSIGAELARMGVPVIASTTGINYFPQDDFLEFGRTEAEYFEKLSALFDRPMALKTIAHAYRWYYLYHLGSAVDLSDVVPDTNFHGLPAWKTPKETDVIERVLVGGENIVEISRSELVDSQKDVSEGDENRYLRRHLSRIIHVMHTGELLPGGLDIHGPGRNSSGATLNVDGGETEYTVGGKTYRRSSPLCARLAPLCVE